MSYPRRFSTSACPTNPLGRRGRGLIAGAATVVFSVGLWVGCASQTTFSPIKQERSTAITLENRAVDPLGSMTNRALALVFLSVECPICNRYVPELLRLAAVFAPQGIDFRLVYPNTDESAEAVRKYVEEYQLAPLVDQVLLDRDHVLVRKSGARVTPEVAVFLPGTRLVYRGRIDDRFPALGRDRREPTRRDLEMVLNAIVQAKPVPTSGEPAVGCSIPPLN